MTRSDDNQETSSAARLAHIKQEAMRRGVLADAFTEEAILTEAAAQMAERRADREDLVGSVIWSALAAGNRAVPAEPEDADDRLFPQDGRPVDQAGRE